MSYSTAVGPASSFYVGLDRVLKRWRDPAEGVGAIGAKHSPVLLSRSQEKDWYKATERRFACATEIGAG
jgi:hypothetical protein